MNYFGTDGIRGIPNVKLTIELVNRIGMALSVLGNETVAIATDTRFSKDMLFTAITSGCLSRGLNVKFLGVMPTPALIQYSFVHKLTGVMITASHNPAIDNGIKILNKGYKLSIQEERSIEDYIDLVPTYTGHIGSLEYISNATDTYLEYLKKHVMKSKLKIAIDCANGATYQTAPAIFSLVSNNIVVVNHKPNGYNINDNCGSTHLNSLIETVLKEKCDIGFAFDGDGDRVLCVDSKGNIVDGDKIIYIMARFLKEQGTLKDNTIVLSKMSNLGLIKDLKSRGIKVIETEVGDKYIFSKLQEKDLSLGGENSGHIILPHLLQTGDGVLNAIFLIQILSKSKLSLEAYLKDIELYTDLMINLKVKNKTNVLHNKLLFERIEEMKKTLNYDCKIIVRPSGTEQLIRITVMAKESNIVKKYSDELVQLVKESA